MFVFLLFVVVISAVRSRPNREDEELKPAVHDRARRLMVLLQHWGFVAEQVLAEQLWLQIPDLPHHVPHDRLLSPQLHRHRVDEDGPDADHSIQGSIPQDLRSQLRLLHLRRLRQHFAPILAGLLQPGNWRHHALFHRRVCLPHDAQEGGLAHVRHPHSCCHWSHNR